MTELTDHERFRQPTVKRLGLEDGWALFCPHFLNLGVPVLFVDACLIPEAEHLGFEPFGTRKPDAPLPMVDLHMTLLGNGVTLHNAHRHRDLMTSHWFRAITLPQALQSASHVGILVGESYALDLTWSALWTCCIGAACPDSLLS